MTTTQAGVPRTGRRPATSRGELSRIGLELFAAHGYDATTVEDIAAAAGIGRRTFFRYYASKNDVVWGDFEDGLDAMREWLRRCPDEVPLLEALRRAVLEFNRVDADALSAHRARMTLILRVPALQAHSTLRYAAWRDVVAEFVARRRGVAVDDLLPQVLGHALLGVALAAYERWLGCDDAALPRLLDEAVTALVAGVGRDAPPTVPTDRTG